MQVQKYLASLTAEQREAIQLAYYYSDYDCPVEELIQSSDITLHTGIDNQEYVWFYDGVNNFAVNVATQEYINDSNKVDELFAVEPIE